MSRTILPVWLAHPRRRDRGRRARGRRVSDLAARRAGRASLLLTFVIQLALQRKEETVTRMIFSIGGALVILLGATVVLAAPASGVPFVA